MHWREIDRGELVAVAGGIILAVSIILPWFSLGNAHALLNSCRGPNTTCNAWHAFRFIRYFLVVGAVAPFILLYIVVRGHGVGWARGEVTALVAILMVILILFRGVVDKPGSPRSEFHVDYGFGVALVGAFVIIIGALYRAQESAPRSKPPGVM